MMQIILLLSVVALSAARPDVSHVINGVPSFDYGVPLIGAPNAFNQVTASPKLYSSATQNLLARLTKEDVTGYDYPKPTIPFDLPAPSSVSIVQTNLDENRQYLPPVAETRVSTTVVPISTTAKYLPPRVAAASTPRPLLANRDYLPPLRPAASAVSPRVVNRDYLPPVTTEKRVSTTTYVPPVTSETRISSAAYLPPATAETRISTTTYVPARPAVIYNRTPIPAAASPVPVTVAAEETTGYDYPKPTVKFDLPSPSPTNDAPVVVPSTSREYLPPVAPSVPIPSPSAPPLILIPSSTTQQTVISSTQPDLPPAPEVILPSHTLDEDGYKYRIPDKPFNF
ncbi:uncharacterized protein LOC129792438 [Lutzomyia longipalpis]|uniref:uncharacterized protein LOC129792438 n=1 Tax=Lutzomyia longipalpis TaxID=7200 RepID=UPI0024836832|nr:uncharacterized protein LOC129792438 [Lutzomyia longipalpis]